MKELYREKFIKYLVSTLFVIVPLTALTGVLLWQMSGWALYKSVLYLSFAGIIIGLLSVLKNFRNFIFHLEQSIYKWCKY